jgi:hypothetical protein
MNASTHLHKSEIKSGNRHLIIQMSFSAGRSSFNFLAKKIFARVDAEKNGVTLELKINLS